MTLNLKCANKRLSFADKECIVAVVGDNNDYFLHFDIDDERAAMFATIKRDGKQENILLDENSNAQIPLWALKSGNIYVGLFSNGFASTPLQVCVIGSIVNDTGVPAEDVKPSETEQLIELVNKIKWTEGAKFKNGHLILIQSDGSEIDCGYIQGGGGTGIETVEIVNNELVISLTNGEKVNVGNVKGDKGDKGEPGEKGETGETPKLSIGIVTTLEPGEEASASISGTKEEPVLNLSIPKGEKGEKGDKGATGSGGSGGGSSDDCFLWKKVFSGTLTEAQKLFYFYTFADGTPLRYSEILIRGAATTDLDSGLIQALNFYYGWEKDGIFNAYKVLGFIPSFCQTSGTDISKMEYSGKVELIGNRIFAQYGYAIKNGVTKVEVRDTDGVDVFTQLALWSGRGGTLQPGSWLDIYARCCVKASDAAKSANKMLLNSVNASNGILANDFEKSTTIKYVDEIPKIDETEVIDTEENSNIIGCSEPSMILN